MSIMNTKLKVVTLALLLGTATVAAAETPATQASSRAQAFADQLQQFQNLSSTAAGTYTFHPAPTLGYKPQDPVGNESFGQRFADMQAASSNSSEWQETQPTLTANAADPVGKEPFAERFAEMQAASSNSGEWSFHPGTDVPVDGANSTLVVAKPISHVARSPVAASQK